MRLLCRVFFKHCPGTVKLSYLVAFSARSTTSKSLIPGRDSSRFRLQNGRIILNLTVPSEALSFEMAAIGVKVKIVEPGIIKTDFGGRSLDFNNDESLTEYQSFVQKLVAPFGRLGDSGSKPKVVAEVIYQAATDGTDQLRYTAGPDAAQIVANRKAADDATFLSGIKSQFGL